MALAALGAIASFLGVNELVVLAGSGLAALLLARRGMPSRPSAGSAGLAPAALSLAAPASAPASVGLLPLGLFFL